MSVINGRMPINSPIRELQEKDAVKYFKDYMDFCEKDGMGIPSKEPYNLAIAALEEVQKYRKFEERLKKIYGDCPGLLELVIDHLEAHEGVDLPEPIFKARLLTDGNVDKWEAYKQIGTVEEQQEAMKKQMWIPCSERMPDVEDLHEKSIGDCKSYLIQRRCGVIDVANYIKLYDESYFSSRSVKITDVLAWQPLPEPYMKVE